MRKNILTVLLALSTQLMAQNLECPTHVYSLPGKPFMHKLVTDEGHRVNAVKGLPACMKLDVITRDYAFIHGTAPVAPGTYTYTAIIDQYTPQEKEVTCTLEVREKLPQPTPFMGLLTWNAFQNNINQEVVTKLAESLVSLGLKDVGYDHMCIDDQWAAAERTNGRLIPDTQKFPSFNKLTDHVHKLGLKIGIYSDAAERTCSEAMPGSWLYEETDAKDFVKWGFDLLKYDYCGAPAEADSALFRYSKMSAALKKAVKEAGKDPDDFLFYMCEWGDRSPWLWAAESGASCWRATADTRDYWSDTMYKGGIIQSIDRFKHIWAYQGVNRWNDADMLVVGLHGTGYSSNDGGGDGYQAGLTQDEAQSNFALWCMWSSPLILSNNITNLDGKLNNLTKKEVINTFWKEDLDIITNKELIAIDQDPLGQGAEPIIDTEHSIAFAKDLANGDVALSITNLSSDMLTLEIPLSNIPGISEAHTYEIRDLILHKDLPAMKGTENIKSDTLQAHQTQVFRLHKK